MAQILFDQVRDFTGGVNYRADQFQLAKNESPFILNMEVDPRGGVFTRAGYKKKHTNAVVTPGTTWLPKGLYNYEYPSSPQIMLTTGYTSTGPVDGKVFYSSGTNFLALNSAVSTPVAVKSTNGASFAQWEDTLYITLGRNQTQMAKWTVGDTYTTALAASGPTWQPYDTGGSGYMPRAELCISHANKLFVANTYEDGTAYPNRIRWSHENLPEAWYQQDYIDIIAGGEGIRGIQVLDGQLVIFKPKAVYLLMGYDADSFQLVELTTVVGIDYPQQAVAGSGGVYFFDYPLGLFFIDRNGIRNLFDRLKPIIDTDRVNSSILSTVTCSFMNDRLWLSMPFDIFDTGSNPNYVNCNFVFDPSIGPQGAFTLFQSATYDNDTDTDIDGWGLVSGIDWKDSTDTAWHLAIMPDTDFPFVMYVDEYDNVNDDLASGDNDGDIATYYRTSWFYDDRYVQDKTFVKSLYVVKEVESETQIRVDVYHDFNTLDTVTSSTLALIPTSTGGLYGTATYSTDGSGGVYGTQALRQGIQVGGRLKTAKAVQLEFIGPTGDLTNTTGRAWGLNSIAFKYKRRKIRSTK